MSKISIIGLDIAKTFFQVHAADESGRVVEQKKLRRDKLLAYFTSIPPCLVGIEACATAHYWGRELSVLGHEVKLIPPAYVKPYVRRGKSDAIDAAAICEAVSRHHLRCVPIKTPAQQAALMLHKTRDLLIGQRTQTGNALRAHLAEFGFVFVQGEVGIRKAVAAVSAPLNDLPELAREALQLLAQQVESLQAKIRDLTQKITQWHKNSEESRILATIPGIGPIGASAIAATIGDASAFASGREFAAWLGLTPKQHSSGGKEKLGSISRQGNHRIRRLLVLGATGQLRGKRAETAAGGQWFAALLKRKPPRLATVALANKMARVAWAVLAKHTEYQHDYSSSRSSAA